MIEIFADGKRIDHLAPGQKCWIDCHSMTKEEAESLRLTYSLHPVTVEDLLNVDTRIKVEEFPEYLFCIFYGLQKKGVAELYEIDFIIGKDFLITSHLTPIPSFEEIKGDEERLSRLLHKPIDMIFHRLIDIEVDLYFPALQTYDESIEELEERATSKPDPSILQEILRMKREIIAIRRAVIPQREKFSFLAKTENKFISKKAIPYFRDVYDHTIRVTDMVDSYRESVGSAFDVYMSAVSNRMAEVMKLLSMIATIALPLTVISGIYGTNFKNIPGAGGVYGFWVMILGMACLSGTMLFFFRRRGWF